MIQYFMIFDIETLGLPIKWDAPINDTENWPGILEIAWQLYNDERELINQESFVIQIKPGELSNEIQDLTGITEEYASKNGILLITALKEFIAVLQKFRPILVAHNCDFDIKVIEATLLKNNINFSLSATKLICTMKASADFCRLPNNKYAKLAELYQILFGAKPVNLHRASKDVEITVESFFKLVDLGIIKIESQAGYPPVDLHIIKQIHYDQAVDNYISDINNYPIFYDIGSTSHLHQKDSSEIFNKYNKYYQTSKAIAFEIPYNQVAGRIVIALKIDDIIIRYILKNYIQQQTNFVSSLEKYNESRIAKLYKKEIEKGNPISVKIDIYDCYESINHDLLIRELSNTLAIKEDSTFLTVFNNALKVVYEDSKGNMVKKKKGLLIGSKPDEYFADLFLSKIEDAIKKIGVSVIRMSDEFIYFTNDVSDARKKLILIQEVIEFYSLSINKSKTIITDYRNDLLSPKLDLLITDGIESGSNPYYTRSFKIVANTQDTNLYQIEAKKQKNILRKKSEKDILITSYETSIIFLKQLIDSRNDILDYQTKYPEYKFLYNIVFSQPTDFRIDFGRLNIAVLNDKNITKLKKIIFNYPKSEYYTAIALDLLVFAANNSVYDDNHDYGVYKISQDLTVTCKMANLMIIEILKSSDIHPYQKYLLIRTIFKNKNNLYINEKNYLTEYVNYYDFDSMASSQPDIPFKKEVLKVIEQLGVNQSHYALRTICQIVSPEF